MPMRTLPDAPSDAGIRPAGVSRRSGPLKFSAPASEAGGAATTPRLNPLEMPIPAGRPTSPSTLERHRIDLATISTHQRILLREPGEINTSEDWLSSSQASQDKRELVKATRRLVKKKLANPAKTFNRVLAVPEDEQAVIEFRRETQEDEWKQILAKSSKRSRSAASRSRVSGSDSFADSLATSATSGATRTSQVTAGFKSEDVAWRAEDNRCAAYGKMCLAFAPGDVLPRQPVLPLEPKSAAVPECLGDAELEALAPRSGLGKLGRLLQMGTRPR
mmetsp:Transcript_16066/g.28666  ORF Transcript_16066/g.28666 Transcript_16066/m.28666 type:complete len:276 (+) Transcript_16066:41-868(+)